MNKPLSASSARKVKAVRITTPRPIPSSSRTAKKTTQDGEGISSDSDVAFAEAMEEEASSPAAGGNVIRNQHEEDLEAHRALARQLLGNERGWLIDDGKLAEAQAWQAAEEVAEDQADQEEEMQGNIFENLPPYIRHPPPGRGKTVPGTNIPMLAPPTAVKTKASFPATGAPIFKLDEKDD